MLQIDPMVFGVVVLALAIAAVLVPQLMERASADSNEVMAAESPQLEPKRIVVRAEHTGQSVPTGAPRAAAPVRPTAPPPAASTDGLAPLKLPVG
jgi:hypothetical protein